MNIQERDTLGMNEVMAPFAALYSDIARLEWKIF
jgi:hypothetical protein